MKALTVQQPWAWAIIHGGKDVENRTQAWSYRGALAIHAGARISERGLVSPIVRDAWDEQANYDLDEVDDWELGALIGVVDLVDVHEARMLDDESGCCDPWGEQQYGDRRQLVHLVLENPRPLDRPIPCAGKLGLWTPPPDALDELQELAMSG